VSNTVQAPCAFAVERTYAAWVRTGLLAMASGIGAKALLAELLPQWLIIATGSVLVFFSAFCFGAAVWRHLDPGVPPPRADVFRIPPWILNCREWISRARGARCSIRHLVWPNPTGLTLLHVASSLSQSSSRSRLTAGAFGFVLIQERNRRILEGGIPMSLAQCRCVQSGDRLRNIRVRIELGRQCRSTQ